MDAINSILSQNDTLICSPTGYGKTISFITPAIQFIINNPDNKVLIIEPTKDLIFQTNKLLKDFNSKLSQQNIQFTENSEIMVMTPNQLDTLSKMQSNWNQNIKLIIIDECDLLFSFKQEELLQKILQNVPNVQKVLVSATLSTQMENYSKILLKENKHTVQLKDEDFELNNQKIKYYQCNCQNQREIFETLYLFFFLQYIKERTIIYCQSGTQSFKIHFFLKQLGIQSNIWNPLIEEKQREKQLQQFNKNLTKVIILQCQNAEQIRGLDFNNCLTLLLIQSEKIDKTEFQHVIGRCGRGNNINDQRKVYILGSQLENIKLKTQTLKYDQQTFLNSFSYRFNDVFNKIQNEKTINNYKFQLIQIWQGKKGQIAQGFLSSNKDNFKLPVYLENDKEKVIKSITFQ